MLLEQRRYEKDSIINMDNPTESAAYARLWDKAHAEMHVSIDSLGSADLATEDRQSLSAIRADFSTYERGYLNLLAQIRDGQVRTPQDANRVLASYKPAAHRLEANGILMSMRALQRASTSVERPPARLGANGRRRAVGNLRCDPEISDRVSDIDRAVGHCYKFLRRASRDAGTTEGQAMDQAFHRMVVALSLAFAVGTAFADVTVEAPWIRGVVAGQSATGAFMRIRSTEATALVGVTTSVASLASVHRTAMVDGMMSMEPVDSLAIPAHGSLELEPGGFHVMLTGLRAPLRAGQKVPLALTFRTSDGREQTVTVQAEVRNLAAATSPGVH